MSEFKYGVSSVENLVQSPVSAGKHENVKITEILMEEVGDNKIPTLTFKLSFSDGKTLTHREFPINQESIAKNISKFRGATVQEIVERESIKLAASIIHIMSAFVPQEKLIFEADSWKDYASKMVEIAGTAYESNLFRCKVVYTKKGYLSFPKTTVSPWFQNMEEPDTITINPKYDKVVPPAPTAEAQLEASNDDLSASPLAADEDLAF